MHKKILVFLCLLASVSYSATYKTPASIVYQIERSAMNDDGDLTYVKSFLDQGMNLAISKAVKALNDKGEYRLSQQIQNEWDYNFHNSLFDSARDIGDHKGISQWIGDAYNKIEATLGHDFCLALHIDLMLTFNSANVVVRPCSFPMDSIPGPRKVEYARHFVGESIATDSRYEGVVPGACYLVMEAACLVGTSGAGSFVCGLAAGLAEKMMANFVAPNLSDFVYDRACGQLSSASK